MYLSMRMATRSYATLAFLSHKLQTIKLRQSPMTPVLLHPCLVRASQRRRKALASLQQHSLAPSSTCHLSSSSRRSTVDRATYGPSDACCMSSSLVYHLSLTLRAIQETQSAEFYVSLISHTVLSFIQNCSKFISTHLEYQPDLRLIRGSPGHKAESFFLCDLISRLLVKDSTKRPQSIREVK